MTARKPACRITHADWVVLILLAGLALRLVYVANLVTLPWNDMYHYHELARALAAGEPFGLHCRFPLFIFITAALYRVAGVDPLWPRLWNVFAALMLALIIYRLTLAVTRRRRLALLALALAAFHPDLILYCGPVLYQMTLMLMVGLTVYVVVGRDWYGLGGVCLALAVLAKPTAIVLLPLFVLRRATLADWRRRLLPLLVMFAVVMTPWWCRNALSFASPLVYGPGAGMMIYQGNHPGQVNEKYDVPRLLPEMRYYRELSAIYASATAPPGWHQAYVPPAADKYFMLEALHCVVQHPGQALAGYLHKMLIFLSGRHCWFLDYYSSYNFSVSRLPELVMIIMLAFAGYGVLLQFGNDRLRFMAWGMLAAAALYAVFSVLVRYRLIILPLTIVAAAAGMGQFRRDLRRRNWRRAGLLALLLLLVTITTAAAQ